MVGFPRDELKPQVSILGTHWRKGISNNVMAQISAVRVPGAGAERPWVSSWDWNAEAEFGATGLCVATGAGQGGVRRQRRRSSWGRRGRAVIRHPEGPLHLTTKKQGHCLDARPRGPILRATPRRQGGRL